MNKLLIITFYFAPFNETGAYRPLKFVKYLREYGWQPVVLTCKNPGASTSDETLLGDVPSDVPIYKTTWFDVRALFAFRFRRSFQANPAPPVTRTPNQNRSSSLVSNVYHSIMKPDDKITWIPGTFTQALRIIKQEKISALFTTSPPHSIHLLGWLLETFTRIPWVADFRDPWMDHALDIDNNRFSPLDLKLYRFFERNVVEHAKAVVANTATNRTLMMNRYEHIAPHRFKAIYNGFDPEDFPGSNGQHRNHQKLELVYAGTLYDGMSERFFKIVNELVRQDNTLATQLQIRLIGSLENGIQRLLSRLPHLKPILRIENRVPKSKLYTELSKSDVLLYFTYPSRHASGWVPSKLYDYLALQKPIFCIGENGEAADIIRKSRAGTLASPDAPEQIQQQIRQYIALFEKGKLRISPNETFIQQFHRRSQCEQLAEVLTQLK